MNNIIKNYNFLSDAIKIKINYNMKRMTPETQKLILTKSKNQFYTNKTDYLEFFNIKK